MWSDQTILMWMGVIWLVLRFQNCGMFLELIYRITSNISSRIQYANFSNITHCVKYASYIRSNTLYHYINTTLWLCHSSGVWSPVSRRGGPGQVMWNLWWLKWHWGRFFLEYFSFPCQFSFYQLLHTYLLLRARTIGPLVVGMSDLTQSVLSPRVIIIKKEAELFWPKLNALYS
jgi:hypothetical protein